ncbi:glutathione S-transferase family protein [Erythrobacter sp.]|jgi:glutathione S-transferase|uniref:glutathione S-transferase family protein n=1 Tax=Erythrobacter sp. TaxID=1042 RepID=UPI002EC18E67|nr:glutathione S-transferase family protein [Erythrobacter sp.]
MSDSESSDTKPDLLFYGSPLSPFLRKAAAVAIEKGADFDVEPVDIFNMPDWFLAISPMRRIPVLRDRSIAEEGTGGTIADSSAICAYIERKHSQPPLYCEDAFAHGRALAIEEYADTALAMACGMGIFRPIFFARMQGQEPDLDKARATWREDMPPILQRLEDMLDGRDWFAGSAISIADIAVTAVLMQIDLVADYALDDATALAAHQKRVRQRPSIAQPFEGAERFVRKALPERFDLT